MTKMMTMTNELTAWLAALRLGEPQIHEHIVVIPVTTPGNGSPPYLTLDEALDTGQLLVTEISPGGSVPALKVSNGLGQPVLLLDGEELRGAKQNRGLNTTILLKEQSETIIPVSCTEQGRWAYTSAKFHASGVIMAHKTRARKSRSVSASLAANAKFRSDQAEVWHEISELHAKAGSASPTGAMHDAFTAWRAALEGTRQHFACVPGQTGLLALVDGEVVGLDVVSRPEAYARLHPKLLRSYLIEALIDKKNTRLGSAEALGKARAFVEEAAQCDGRQFSSLGHGVDCRYQKPGLAGTALVHDGHVVHAAFFRVTAPTTDHSGMASLRERRQWRGE